MKNQSLDLAEFDSRQLLVRCDDKTFTWARKAEKSFP